MKIKILVTFLIFLIILNFATLGSYVYYRWIHPQRIEYPREFMPERPRMRPPRLNSEQRKKLLHLRREFQKTTRPYLDEKSAIRGEIANLILQEPVDTAAIYDRLNQIEEIQKEIDIQAISMLIKTRQFLTPDQMSAFYAMLDMYGNRPERRPGMMPPMRRNSLNNKKDSLPDNFKKKKE